MNLNSYQYIIMPIFSSRHWTIFIRNNTVNIYVYYNSLGFGDTSATNQYFDSKYKIYDTSNSAQQENSIIIIFNKL